MIIITVGEIIGAVLLGFVLTIAAVVAAIDASRRHRCPHDAGVSETQACDAICHECGKNLGFIGDWRDAQKKRAP
jgi:hypothetical protein